MLFRIYPHTYSTSNRPKRTLPIPKKYWGFFVPVFEFPQGVVIDEHGIIQPLLKVSKKYPAYPIGEDDGEDDEDEDEEFVPLNSEEEEEGDSDESSEEEEAPCKKRKYTSDSESETEEEETESKMAEEIIPEATIESQPAKDTTKEAIESQPAEDTTKEAIESQPAEAQEEIK